ncbi:MAG TPA: hypothetical protein VGE41_03480 [Verrucomicrobiae bacterium]|jgi:Flp pilus assembly protein TadD
MTKMIRVCSALALALLLSACASKQKQQIQQLQLQQAAMAGAMMQMAAQTNQAGIPPEMQGKAVVFIGDIRHRYVLWTEGMNLAQAILAAEYTGTSDPRIITVVRAGQPYPVNVRLLLKGQENPELQPGDVVEIRR